MYDLHPPRVFVHRRVLENRLATARLERMLRGLGNPPVQEVGSDEADTVSTAAGIARFVLPGDVRPLQGRLKPATDPVMLFNTFVWDAGRRTSPRTALVNTCATSVAMLMAGVGEEFAFSQRELNDPNRAFVCQGGWGIHSLDGCVHRCAYCPEGYVVNVMLDLEEFADHVGAMLRRRPEQKVFRYDLYSDQPCFEPEYGASEILSDLFARTADQYLLFYTKSDNVDHLLTLPRRDHSIYYCTLATDTAACLFEPGAPGLDRRIEGLRRCQEAGFAVRVGFSPIIPVANWRAEATAMLERLLAKVRPETVRLWVLSLMAAAELEAALDVSALDAEIVAAMRRATMDAVGWWNGPFPRETRAEIYAHYIDEMRRVSPETPVSLCSEERAVWELLAGKLRMSPDRLFCCCGGTSVPIRRP